MFWFLQFQKKIALWGTNDSQNLLHEHHNFSIEINPEWFRHPRREDKPQWCGMSLSVRSNHVRGDSVVSDQEELKGAWWLWFENSILTLSSPKIIRTPIVTMHPEVGQSHCFGYVMLFMHSGQSVCLQAAISYSLHGVPRADQERNRNGKRPCQRTLSTGAWYVLTLGSKWPELVGDTWRRRLDIHRLPSSNGKVPVPWTYTMEEFLLEWTLPHKRVFSGWSGDSDYCRKPASEPGRPIHLRFDQIGVFAIVQFYGQNGDSDHDAWLEELDGTLERIPRGECADADGSAQCSHWGR